MPTKRKTHRDRCREEGTRDVIFLLQYTHDGPKRMVRRWETEGVWLDRDEAQAYLNAHHYNYSQGCARVYGVPANGQLAALLKAQDGGV